MTTYTIRIGRDARSWTEATTSDLGRAIRIAAGEDEAPDLHWSPPEHQEFDEHECSEIYDEDNETLVGWDHDGWSERTGTEDEPIIDIEEWFGLRDELTDD